MPGYETVLVTGAGGLIGSATTRLLLGRGSRVVACDDFSGGSWDESPDGLVWERADLSEQSIGPAIERHGVDAVVHCAAHPGGRSLKEPVDDVRVNALGSMRVFEACAHARIPVVYLSSSAVYGDQPAGPIPETAPLDAGTVYAACKIACERFLGILEEGHGLQWTTLRLFATYGAGHRPGLDQGIANIMLTQLLAGDQIEVRGSLERTRDMLYVDDAAAAIVTCLSDPAARGRILNVGTGVATSIRELIESLCRALGRDPAGVTITETAGTVGDPFHSVADAGRIAEHGWSAQVTLAEGLQRLADQRVSAEAG